MLGVTLFWLTALLQRRCRVGLGRGDLQDESDVVWQGAPIAESSKSKASDEAEDHYW